MVVVGVEFFADHEGRIMMRPRNRAATEFLDALKPLGVKEIDMPATPARVWDAMSKARAA